VPGAAAQAGFTGFQASSTGLISEEGFVSLGTTVGCAVATNGALVSATLEQRRAGGTSTASAFAGRQAGGALCAPGGSPLALGFGAPEGRPFKPGRAVLSAQACVGKSCSTADGASKKASAYGPVGAPSVSATDTSQTQYNNATSTQANPSNPGAMTTDANTSTAPSQTTSTGTGTMTTDANTNGSAPATKSDNSLSSTSSNDTSAPPSTSSTTAASSTEQSLKTPRADRN